MDDGRIGRVLRALRRRRGLRQVDVAVAAGVSQSTVSLIERGHLDTLAIRTVRMVFAAVDARYVASVTWRGGEVERVVDERHARLVGALARHLVDLGWEVHVEVTFAEFGERGSIDILALRPGEGIALIVEIKSELVRVDETIRRLDVKERLAPVVVSKRLGWRPTVVSRLLVIEEGATARRRVAVHDGALRVAFPERGRLVLAWLQRPAGRISGLRFFSSANGSGTGRARGVDPGPIRVRRPPRSNRFGR
jgi:transcriptional regulator with XRE-family HTH domain